MRGVLFFYFRLGSFGDLGFGFAASDHDVSAKATSNGTDDKVHDWEAESPVPSTEDISLAAFESVVEVDAVISPDDGENTVDDEADANGNDGTTSHEAWEFVSLLEVVEPSKKEKDKGG